MNKRRLFKKLLATSLVVAVVAAGVLFAARQSATQATTDGKLPVVATYYPLYEFARQVGGDKIHVTNMTPAGAEPHDYEPPAKALADAGKAAVFIYNGTHMELWTDEFISGYKQTAVKSSASLPLLQAQDEENPARMVQDPHFWLDPVLAARIVDGIKDGLVSADPANASYYNANATAFKAQLAELDTAFRTGLQTCKHRTIITSHEAFSYLGTRYSLEILPIAGLTPEAEPSPAELAALSDLVRDRGIRYVFFEQLASPQLADTIAKETGAQTLVFDPIEGLSDADQKQGKTYISIQRDNLRNLRTALACE